MTTGAPEQLAALHDETMARTAMLVEGTLDVTANLEVKYRKPAPTGVTYTVAGRLADRRGRRLLLEASVLADGKVVADATGLFLATDPVVP